jgi:hypothetical protein
MLRKLHQEKRLGMNGTFAVMSGLLKMLNTDIESFIDTAVISTLANQELFAVEHAPTLFILISP